MPRALSPWALDQRRIRRLRTNVRAQYKRAEGWMRCSNNGWQLARDLFAALKAGQTPEQLAAWEKRFENEPF